MVGCCQNGSPPPLQATQAGVRAGLSRAGPSPPTLLLVPVLGLGGGAGNLGEGNATPLQLAMPTVPSEVSDSLLEELIAAHLVLPNRVTVPVKKGLDVTNLLFPLPCVSTSTSHGAQGLGLRDGWACRGNAFSDDNCLCPVRAWLPYSIGGRLNLEKVD